MDSIIQRAKRDGNFSRMAIEIRRAGEMTIYVICWKGTERCSSYELVENTCFDSYESAAKYQSEHYSIGQTHIRPLKMN